jgi:16S rRNA (guanine527-N7)-methyltransferase
MAGRYKLSVDRFPDFEKTLLAGAASLGVPLAGEQAGRFLLYARLLQKWGSRINLTSRLEPEEIISLHFLDSLALLLTSSPPAAGALLADIGSGAGFPGIPLSIARPDLPVTLVESSRKKAAFCSEVTHRLGLDRILVRSARAEDLVDGTPFDWVVSRATAPMERLLSLADPLLRPGGRLAAWKGPGEGQACEGWLYRGETRVNVPGRNAPRAIVIFEKS